MTLFLLEWDNLIRKRISIKFNFLHTKKAWICFLYRRGGLGMIRPLAQVCWMRVVLQLWQQEQISLNNIRQHLKCGSVRFCIEMWNLVPCTPVMEKFVMGWIRFSGNTFGLDSRISWRERRGISRSYSKAAFELYRRQPDLVLSLSTSLKKPWLEVLSCLLKSWKLKQDDKLHRVASEAKSYDALRSEEACRPQD